jgi:Tir chaperone protein (CesT) family
MSFSLQDALQVLGDKFNISHLHEMQDGRYVINTPDFEINLEEAESTGSVFFYAKIGEAPDQENIDLYSRLLEGNFFTRETAGASLGIDRATQTILLFMRISALELNDQHFEARLLNFMDAVDYWVRVVDAYLEAMEEPADPVPSSATRSFIVRG